MINGRMFDGLFTGLIIIGIIIGLCLAGLGWGVVWLFNHIQLIWV